MIKAYIFDAFGTLFNLDGSLLDDIKHPSVSDILSYARDKQLSYTWLRSLMKSYMPFDEITTIALEDGCRKFNADSSLVEKLLPLYMLNSGIKKNDLSRFLDHVFSVDDIKVFKPDPAVYQMVTKKLSMNSDEVLFISSNQWDVAGAASFGFNVAWVNRSRGFRESITRGNNIKEVFALTDLLSD